jgi:hypothetical protein
MDSEKIIVDRLKALSDDVYGDVGSSTDSVHVKTPNWTNISRDATIILLNKVNDRFTRLNLDEGVPVVIDRENFESIRSSTQTEFQIIFDINKINTESNVSVIGLCKQLYGFRIIPDRLGNSLAELSDLWRRALRP